MSKPEEVEALFKETAAAFKDPVNILVNNAGITKDGTRYIQNGWCLGIRDVAIFYLPQFQRDCKYTSVSCPSKHVSLESSSSNFYYRPAEICQADRARALPLLLLVVSSLKSHLCAFVCYLPPSRLGHDDEARSLASRHRHQPVGCLLRLQGGRQRHAAGPPGPHHQHGLGRGTDRQPRTGIHMLRLPTSWFLSLSLFVDTDTRL